MKKKNNIVPAPSKLTLLRQICNLIPQFLVPKLSRETGVEDKVRTFSAWLKLVSAITNVASLEMQARFAPVSFVAIGSEAQVAQLGKADDFHAQRQHDD